MTASPLVLFWLGCCRLFRLRRLGARSLRASSALLSGCAWSCALRLALARPLAVSVGCCAACWAPSCSRRSSPSRGSGLLGTARAVLLLVCGCSAAASRGCARRVLCAVAAWPVLSARCRRSPWRLACGRRLCPLSLPPPVPGLLYRALLCLAGFLCFAGRAPGVGVCCVGSAVLRLRAAGLSVARCCSVLAAAACPVRAPSVWLLLCCLAAGLACWAALLCSSAWLMLGCWAAGTGLLGRWLSCAALLPTGPARCRSSPAVASALLPPARRCSLPGFAP
jgi:hypothetical protein